MEPWLLTVPKKGDPILAKHFEKAQNITGIVFKTLDQMGLPDVFREGRDDSQSGRSPAPGDREGHSTRFVRSGATPRF